LSVNVRTPSSKFASKSSVPVSIFDSMIALPIS
jgi:hypothetical protein